jgi:hypothetical protein
VLINKQLTRKNNFWYGFKMKRVFVISYPRSGNMFVRTLLAHIAFPEEEWTSRSITKKFAPDLYHIGDIGKEWFTNPGIYKTHSQYSSSIEAVLYIYRHGLSVANSMYNRLARRPSFDVAWDKYYWKFLKGHRKWGKWEDHVEGWMFNRTRGIPFLSVKYEELNVNPGGEARRIVDFLGWKKTGVEIDKAVEDTALFYINSYHGNSRNSYLGLDYVLDFARRHSNLLTRLGYYGEEKKERS